MRHAIFVPNFGTFSDPALVADLAAAAEAAGWDGWFLWDHVVHRSGDEQLADPWITLAAVAVATSTMWIGPMITPVPRRRPWNVARQAATLDHLSRGRTVLGVGIGASGTPEFSQFSEEPDPVVRGEMLDEGLQVIRELWRGQEIHHSGAHYRVEGVTFVPRPVQDPLPVWVAAVWPARRPVRRAARFEGIVPLNLPGPETLSEILSIVGQGKDVVVHPGGYSAREWEAAGATWLLHEISATETAARAAEMLGAGPPAT
jgi:alkanesulfonate monooxygenase SsuD/methylene tetrahydromethanopterin reductase-like flavin-dependent oxidoreductase (luciferase family)